MEASGNECEKTRVENSVLDSLIDLLPFQMHIPTYEFCGPGTRLQQQDSCKPKNKLDEACHSHDLAYANNEDRRRADRILADKAFARMFASQAEPDERTAALITACCMISKITFEKCFDRITKTIRKLSGGKRKTKNSRKVMKKKSSMVKKQLKKTPNDGKEVSRAIL